MRSVALVLACAAPFEGPWVPVPGGNMTPIYESIPHVPDLEQFVSIETDKDANGVKARALVSSMMVRASVTVRLELE